MKIYIVYRKEEIVYTIKCAQACDKPLDICLGAFLEGVILHNNWA